MKTCSKVISEQNPSCSHCGDKWVLVFEDEDEEIFELKHSNGVLGAAFTKQK
jgi:hypothetical protein